MKMHCIVVAAVAALAIGSSARASTMQTGGARLVAKQFAAPDNAWGFAVTDATSARNTLPETAMGLAKAYEATGDPTFKAALKRVGTRLISNVGQLSLTDGYLAAELDRVFANDIGEPNYSAFVKTNFYDQIPNMTTYVNTIRTNLGASNLAAWDLGMGLVAAASVGADTAPWIAGVKSEIGELTAGNYDVIGLAGALYGLAFVHEDFDPTVGRYAAASNVRDLMNILATYQISTGGFTWYTGTMDANSDETVQETAYAVLAMSAFDKSAYWSSLVSADAYLRAAQLPLTFGWANYVGAGENNAITGETLWSLQAIPEPASLALFGIGSAFLARRRKA